MRFRTVSQAIESHPRVFSKPGDSVKVLYTPVFDERGHMELKESGKENLYDFIQSHKESVDIHVILARFAAGDTTALAKRQVYYTDITEFPTTYADVVNMMHTAQDYFEHLPVETRAKYDHDFNKFLASMDNPQTFVDLGLVQTPAPNTSLNNVPQSGSQSQVPPDPQSPSVTPKEGE